MNKNSKLLIGLIIIIVIGGIIYFGKNTKLFRGSMEALKPVLYLSKASNFVAQNIPAGANNVVLGRFELTPVDQDIEIRQISYSVTRSAPVDLVGTFKFNIKEKDSTDVSVLYSVAGSRVNYKLNNFRYKTNFVKLTVGKTYYLEASANIASNAPNGLIYTVEQVDITQVQIIPGKEGVAGHIVDPGVVPVTGPYLTVATGSLTISKAATGNENSQVTAGTKDVAFATYKLQANNDNIGIKKIKLTYASGSGDGKVISNITVYRNDKLLKTGDIDLVLGSVSTAVFGIGESYKILKDTSEFFTIKADVVSNIGSCSEVQFQIEFMEGESISSNAPIVAQFTGVKTGAVKTICP